MHGKNENERLLRGQEANLEVWVDDFRLVDADIFEPIGLLQQRFVFRGPNRTAFAVQQRCLLQVVG